MQNGTARGSGGEKRDYTPEQEAVVKRVRSCKITEYYEILSVKKECEEAEVKKAYRKVCLLFYLIIYLFGIMLILVLNSSPFSYILTRTVLLVQMKHSRVSVIFAFRRNHPAHDLIFESGLKGFPSSVR